MTEFTGPSDEKCYRMDARLNKNYDLGGIRSLGYESFHRCLRDKILAGLNIIELEDTTHIPRLAIRNAAVRMHLRIKPVREGHGGGRRKNEDEVFVTERKYEEHRCSAHGCNRMTTNRFLCRECYMKGDENEYYYE